MRQPPYKAREKKCAAIFQVLKQVFQMSDVLSRETREVKTERYWVALVKSGSRGSVGGRVGWGVFCCQGLWEDGWRVYVRACM